MRPSSMRSVVVFPAPLGPRKPKTSPRCTSRSSESTAVIDAPYRFVRPWVVMTFPFAIGISFTNRSVTLTVDATRVGRRHLYARFTGPLGGGAGVPRAGDQEAPGLIR